jgi:hypothetical protein
VRTAGLATQRQSGQTNSSIGNATAVTTSASGKPMRQ